MTIDGEALGESVLLLIVIGAIWWLLWWLLGRVNPPEPFRKVAEIVLMIFAVLACINVLLGIVGHPIVKWK